MFRQALAASHAWTPTEAQGPGRWKVRLDFPGEARRAYAAAISLSGIRPGVKLADGRRILFNPDWLSVASLLGLLALPLRAVGSGALL